MNTTSIAARVSASRAGGHRENPVADVAIKRRPTSRTARTVPPLRRADTETFWVVRSLTQKLDDLLAYTRQVVDHADQHLGANAFALAHQSEQHVLGADVVVVELKCLA